MSIKTITTEELRHMWHDEGLILQGCGGDLNEWVDGINELLTEDGILLDGTKFNADNVRTFEHNKLTCLLLPFDDSVKLNMSKFAVWRLKTHEQFGGTWLSDFVPNSLGGFLPDEPQKNQEFFGKINTMRIEEDVYTSPNFQCEQTCGFPVSLCVCNAKGLAWLELNYSMVGDEDVSAYEQMCADFGFKQCCDTEQYNNILRGLGEDAIQSAGIIPDDEDIGMQL